MNTNKENKTYSEEFLNRLKYLTVYLTGTTQDEISKFFNLKDVKISKELSQCIKELTEMGFIYKESKHHGCLDRTEVPHAPSKFRGYYGYPIDGIIRLAEALRDTPELFYTLDDVLSTDGLGKSAFRGFLLTEQDRSTLSFSPISYLPIWNICEEDYINLCLWSYNANAPEGRACSLKAFNGFIKVCGVLRGAIAGYNGVVPDGFSEEEDRLKELFIGIIKGDYDVGSEYTEELKKYIISLSRAAGYAEHAHSIKSKENEGNERYSTATQGISNDALPFLSSMQVEKNREEENRFRHLSTDQLVNELARRNISVDEVSEKESRKYILANVLLDFVNSKLSSLSKDNKGDAFMPTYSISSVHDLFIVLVTKWNITLQSYGYIFDTAARSLSDAGYILDCTTPAMDDYKLYGLWYMSSGRFSTFPVRDVTELENVISIAYHEAIKC